MRRIVVYPVLLMLLSAVNVKAQIQLNKELQFVGTGTDAKISGIKDVSAAQDATSAEVVQSGTLNYAVAGGTADAITLSLTPAPAAYTAGMMVNFKSSAANTGAVTLDVNGLGPVAVKKNVTADLSAGDVSGGGQLLSAIYDGTNFQLISAVGGGAQLPAGTQVLIYSDESNSSRSSGSGAGNVKTYNLPANAYSKIAVEVEGSLSISMNGGSSVSSDVALNIAGSDVRTASFSHSVVNGLGINVPFFMKTVRVQQSGTTIDVNASFSTGGAGFCSVHVAALRVYGIY